MQRSVLLFVMLLLTAFATAVEYFFGAPLMFAAGVFYAGLVITAAAIAFCLMLHYGIRDIFWSAAGGIVCTATANAMLCLLWLVQPHLAEDSLLLAELLLMCVYMVLTAVGAIYVYLYCFCGFAKILKQID